MDARLSVAALALMATAVAGCGDDSSPAAPPVATVATPSSTSAATTSTTAAPSTTTTATTSTTTITTTSTVPAPVDDQIWTEPVNGIEVAGEMIWAASIRADEIIAFDRRDGTLRVHMPVVGSQPDDVTLGPDGAVYWTGFGDGTVGRVIDGYSEVVATIAPGVNGIAFTDDGELVVSQAVVADALDIVPLDGSPPREVAAPVGDMNAFAVIGRAVLGPTGGVAGPGAVTRVDLDTGGVTVVVDDLVPVVASVLGPDGALYLLGGVTGEVLRHELGTATAEPFVALPTGFYDNLAFAPDGTLYVSSFTDPVVVVVAPDGTTSTLRIGTAP